jgi:hypothetical protein
MVAQIDKIDFFCRPGKGKDDEGKDIAYFSNRRTLKCCPHTPYKPSVFVCRLFQNGRAIQDGVWCKCSFVEEIFEKI